MLLVSISTNVGIKCPGYGRKLEMVTIVHRQPALKINQGTVKKTRI